jgi:hypothetical protein
MKAYDSVRWDFLLVILQMFGFPSCMVNWNSECISTSRFSVSINRELHGFFAGSRGLRQGDPLSLYLFVLVMKVLGLLGQMARHSDFRFHWPMRRRKLLIYAFLMI